MKKRVEEQSLRTVALAALGFAALMVVVPDWARLGVLVFAAVFAGLAYLVDPSVRTTLLHWIPVHRRRSGARDDVTSAGAKSPAARRAAT